MYITRLGSIRLRVREGEERRKIATKFSSMINISFLILVVRLKYLLKIFFLRFGVVFLKQRSRIIVG